MIKAEAKGIKMNVAVLKTKAEQALTDSSPRSSLPGGPALAQAREEAIGRFAALGLPHRRDRGVEIHRPARGFARGLPAG